jgi:hypothetical protein
VLEKIIFVGEADIIGKAEMVFEPERIIDSIETKLPSWEDKIKETWLSHYSESKDVLVCSTNYLDVGKVIFEIGIQEFYVFVDGLFFRSDQIELMRPIELYEGTSFKKKSSTERSILFINKLAYENVMVEAAKKRGFTSILGNITCWDKAGENYDLYRKFSSMNGMREFIESSDIDLISCAQNSESMASIALLSNIPVIYCISNENLNENNLILQKMIYKGSAGIIFCDAKIKEIYEKQFGEYAGKSCVFQKDFLIDNSKDYFEIIGGFYEKVASYK